jgi:hypothetical protein
MWAQFDGKPYSRALFPLLLASIPDEQLSWIKFICLHNTAAPSIAQWQASNVPQRIVNLQRYYEVQKGWKSGPHGFIPPDPDICIYGFTPFWARGVHASCYNKVAIGLEMVGDFDTESFDDGAGGIVQSNAVFVMAALYNRLSLRPDGYIAGEAGLHFHIDCARDNHACPGKHVKRPNLIARVLEEMERQRREEELKRPPPAVAVLASGPVVSASVLSPEPPVPVLPAQPDPAPKPGFRERAAVLQETIDMGSRLGGSIRGGLTAVRVLLASVFGIGTGTVALVDKQQGTAGVATRAIEPFPVLGIAVVAFMCGVAIVGAVAWWYLHRAGNGLVSASRDGRYLPPKQPTTSKVEEPQ